MLRVDFFQTQIKLVNYRDCSTLTEEKGLWPYLHEKFLFSTLTEKKGMYPYFHEKF